MTRKRYTKLQNAAFFLEHGGICHICEARIVVPNEKWEREHVIPLSMGGADDESNMRPAHKRCHKGKTDQDKGNLSRAKNRQANFIGAKADKKKWPKRGFGQFKSNVKQLSEGWGE